MSGPMDFMFMRLTDDAVLLAAASDSSNGNCGKNGRETSSDVRTLSTDVLVSES
jgi:hypothetical protein